MAKYKQVKVNVSESDHCKLSQLAKSEGITLAELFRASVNAQIENAPEPKEKRATIIYSQTDPVLLYELNKVSVSIHQIAESLSGGRNELKLQTLYRIYEEVMSL